VGRTLSIELGIVCNNNCRFCYQRNLRKVRDYPKKMPFLEIKRKLKWGIDNGYVHVGFEGGEPTVRADIVDIISLAKSLGYRRISITTNGRRLASPEFARSMVEAGLNGVGFSIHGPDATTHNAHTMRNRSFEQAMAGIKNILALTARKRIDLNIFTVVTRKNADKLTDIAIMFRKMGIRLFILQPLIFSKGNFTDMQDLVLPVDELVASIRKAIYGGMKNGYHVKLFNLPVCLFSDILPGLEMNPLPPSIFREDETKNAGEMLSGQEDGYVRMPSCKSCEINSICPGIPLSLLPRFDLVQSMRRALNYHRGPTDEIWLTGMEMAAPIAMFDVIRYAITSGHRSVKLLTGGTFVEPLSYEAAIRAGVDEIILVHRPKDPHSGDRLLHFQGNGPFLLDTLSKFLKMSSSAKVSLFSPPGEQLDQLTGQAMDIYPDLNAIRLTLSGQGIHICTPKGSKYIRNLLRKVPRVIIELNIDELTKFFPCLLVLAGISLGRLSVHVATNRCLRTGFSMPQYGMLNWSDPFPLNLKQPSDAVRITAQSLRANPLTIKKLQEAALLRKLNRTGEFHLVE